MELFQERYYIVTGVILQGNKMVALKVCYTDFKELYLYKNYYRNEFKSLFRTCNIVNCNYDETDGKFTLVEGTKIGWSNLTHYQLVGELHSKDAIEVYVSGKMEFLLLNRVKAYIESDLYKNLVVEKKKQEEELERIQKEAAELYWKKLYEKEHPYRVLLEHIKGKGIEFCYKCLGELKDKFKLASKVESDDSMRKQRWIFGLLKNA